MSINEPLPPADINHVDEAINVPLSPKVTASALSGILAALILWGLSAIFNITPPDAVVAGLPLLVGALGGWLKTDPLRELGKHHVTNAVRQAAIPVSIPEALPSAATASITSPSGSTPLTVLTTTTTTTTPPIPATTTTTTANTPLVDTFNVN